MTPDELPIALRRMRQAIVSCVGCESVWIVPGLRHGDTYICKECGRRIVIDQQPRPTRHSQSAATA